MNAYILIFLTFIPVPQEHEFNISYSTPMKLYESFETCQEAGEEGLDFNKDPQTQFVCALVPELK